LSPRRATLPDAGVEPARGPRRIATLVACVALAACAMGGPSGRQQAPDRPTSGSAVGAGTIAAPLSDSLSNPLSDPLRLAGVPFVAQPDWQCGPAALAMAMAAAGREVPVEVLAASAFVPGLRGALQAEMLAATRRQGLLATELEPSLDALRAELAAGRPVVVLQNLGLAAFPRWHYAVLTGVDLARGEVVLHSGDVASDMMRLSTFDRTWARGGRWAMAVTLPERLPASADEARAARALAGLERVDAPAAAPGWDALVARWPAGRIGRFGRGNARLARGDASGAAEDLRVALATDPTFADAWNNLARARAALGDVGGARVAADRAVALGGTRADAYRDTRAALGD
jgi:tetratricopeptide (TPR) repeat protein